MSMSIDGLISGMDTTSLITRLVQAETGQQTALKKRLSAAETAASAYRTVNTTFAAVRAAAQAMLKPDAWNPTKATSSVPGSVAVSASNGAAAGALTFTVGKTAAAHTVMNKNAAGTWTSAAASYGTASITVLDENGSAASPDITIVDKDGDGTHSLSEAAAAINASTHGLTAAVIEHSPGEFGLLVTSRTTGAASQFSLSGAGTYGVPVSGADAELTIGSGPDAVVVRSATNTFTDVMPGVTITVSKPEPVGVTVTVSNDADAVAATMQALVDAVNSALTQVKTYTNNAPGSAAALRGDYAVTQFTGQLLDAISSAVSVTGVPGQTDGTSASAARIGLSLTRDGRVEFRRDEFVAALEKDPELAGRLVAGTDGPPSVLGVADRLLAVANRVSDAATGSLVKLAEGQDALARDLTTRIEAWDLRLTKRREALTRQFSAMETALSSLRNQSTWLAGQINALPSSG